MRCKGLCATLNSPHPSLGTKSLPLPRLCLWYLCVCSTLGNSRSLPDLGLHPLHPLQWKWAPLMGGSWQELNAGRALAQPGTEQGMQLKVVRLPGSAQLREPLRPMGKAQGSFPIQALSSPAGLPVCVLVAQRLFLFSAERAQPAGPWFPCLQQQ